MIKVEGGFEDRQMNGWTDICDCRVAFATDNSIPLESMMIMTEPEL